MKKTKQWMPLEKYPQILAWHELPEPYQVEGKNQEIYYFEERR